jgi:hypothetical protein
MRKIQWLGAILLLCEFQAVARDAKGLRPMELGIVDQGYRAIVSTQEDSILIGASHGIYRFDPKTLEAKSLLSIPVGRGPVLDMAVDPFDPSIVLAVISQGIYLSLNNGETWQALPFSTVGEWELTSAAISADHLWVGSNEGLFVRGWQNPVWQPFAGTLNQKGIFDLAYDSARSTLFIGAEDGLYQIAKDHATRVFSTKSVSEIVSGPQRIYFRSEAGLFAWDGGQAHLLVSGGIDAIAVSEPGWLAYHSNVGTLLSDDEGKSWKVFPEPLREVTKLFGDRERLWVLTEQKVWDLDIDRKFFKREVTALPIPEKGNPFSDEPTIEQVHQAAIQYAQVSQKFPNSWRRRVRKKSWLPKLNVGVTYDRDRDTGFSLDDTLFGSSTNQVIIVAPEISDVSGSDGESIQYDLDLEWNLDRLVYDSDELSVAKQVEDLVELRGDILDQVTKVYYQRRRLQWEFLMSTPKDPLKKNDLRLQIEELTSLLDGWTGGFFSMNLQKEGSE